MTTAQFFEKFDLFAGAPDAVAKMRSLILELAVRGQLTSAPSHPSDPSDPSGNPFPIPGDWRWVTLRDAAETRAAAKVSPSAIADNAWVLDLEDIDGANGRVLAKATFAERRSQSTKAAFVPGDVLYGKLRPYLNKVVVAQAPGFCTTEIIPLRPRAPIMAEFLMLFLRSPHFLKFAEGKSYGMKMPRLGTKDLESAPVPLPPLAEQKRIVAKIDELMALCDQLEAQQQERETKHTALAQATLARFAEAPTPTNLNLLFHSSFSIQPSDLRKTILKLAMHGQLGAHNQIKTVRLDSLGSWAQGCGFPVAEQGHKDRPILFSKVSDMNLPGNEREIKTTNNTIDDKTAKRLRIKVHPKGAVIFPKIGGAIATNKRRILTRPTAIDNNCSGIIPNETCSTEWLYLVLSGIDFAQYQTGTSVPAVNQGALGEIPVALPPLAEQKRIVAKVEELMALVDALEAQQAAADQAATHLLDAVVSELAAA